MGGTTLVGMALDAVLCGGISYAIGYTAKDYFVKGCKMSKSEMRESFKQKFEEGKAKVRKSRQSPA
jgi:flagellar biosynthesis protein FlhB